MDDDSQDELIDGNAAARGVRAPGRVVSEADDSSEDAGASGTSGQDSGSEDGSDSAASEDEDSADEAGPALPASSDEDAESCPICLNVFRGQALGTPESCAHHFCLDCIVEWSKNANSCPVDRILFKWICIRARLGGKVLKKIPVEGQKASRPEEDEEDPTFCEVCGRSDREDRLLLCDGCDAGYHMECLNPSLSEVPVDEWFCPECVATAAPAVPPAATTDTEPVSEEEVALLLVDVVPTTSRLRPNVGRTRAIARTRQSERVRATVNRNRISTARGIQQVPRYLMSSLLDETIEAVASGLSTAVYHRPLTPRPLVRRKRRTGRRKKVSGRKRAPSKSSARSKTSGPRPKRRKSRAKKRRGQRNRVKTEITARSRIARTLGLGKPLRGASIPSVYKPVEPSLGFLRADIGAASLSLFGDPYELDPYDSGEEHPASQSSPLSTKRRVLSQSALRSHQPVARPISVGLSRRNIPVSVPEQDVEVAPVPDLLGSILSGQNLLMMSGSDVVINRDGSLTARKAAPISLQRSSAAKAQESGEAKSRGSVQPRALQPGTSTAHLSSEVSEHLGLNSYGGATTASILSTVSSSRLGGLEKSVSPSSSVPRRAAVKLEYSMTPRPVQTKNLASRSKLGLKPNETPQLNGDKRPVSVTAESPKVLKRTVIGQPLPPAPRRIDISELPRIPKIKREGGSGNDSHMDSKPTGGEGADIPSSCINRLTGREGSGQPARGGRVENKPSGRDSQDPKTHSSGGGGSSGGSCAGTSGTGSHSSLTPFGPSRGKGLGSSFESFRINIPGNTAHASRLPNPGFCNTFRPVDNKVQRKENPSPLFSIKKTKQIKSEIYDPFDPTGSDSSSPNSSPERLGAGLLPSEITRTINVDSPKVPTFQTVRCVTSYTVENVFGSGSDPSDGPSSSHPERISTGMSDLEKVEEEEEEEPGNSPCSSTAMRRLLSEREPLEADGRERRSTFFDSEERTVTCVTIELASPSEEEEEEDQPLATTHRIVEIHSPSRSRSNSSSRSRKKAKRKKTSTKEHKKTRSHSHSRSHSRERSSRSTSWSVEEDYTKKHRFKAKPRRSSSDRSSSHDRAKKKRAKEKRKGPWSRDRRKSRSRSGSPGSSSYEVCESRKKRRRRSSSRGRGREGSRSSSTERARRHKHRRQKSFERYEKKERSSRPRDRRSSRSRSRERRKWRSRSPSASRSREHKRARSREKRPRSRSRSRDRKQPGKDMSPPPVQEKEAKAAEECTPPKLPVPDQAGPSEVDGPQAPPAAEETRPEAQAEAPEEVADDDLDYGETVEAEHVFDDFSSDTVFIQLDDMSSPPSPESTDSSPERGLLLPPALPVGSGQGGLSLGPVAAAKCEAPPEPPVPSEGPPGEAPPSQGAPENQVGEVMTVAEEEGPVVSEEVSEALESEMEVISQIPLLKSKALVKRVTWNLQEEEDSVAGPELEPRPPFYKLPRSLEGAWKAEDLNPSLNQVQSREPPPTNYMVAEPMFPDLDCPQVYSPNLPLTPTLPPSVPPYAPVSQPTVQFIMQGSLPLMGCGAGQSLTPEPAMLAAASEPSSQVPAAEADEKTAPKPVAAEKAKNEEYMKKLHVQERAVEEVKLAIKPFYQKREITKDEYKDILRKAVQKICHSKSGEINPMKVANLVKAYVEKYKHMRKHKKAAEAEEEPQDAGS